MHTTTTITETPVFDVKQMASVFMDREKPPYGLFVSSALWMALVKRTQEEGSYLGQMPQTFHGLQVAIDPALPDTEFEVAYTEKGWSEKLRRLARS